MASGVQRAGEGAVAQRDERGREKRKDKTQMEQAKASSPYGSSQTHPDDFHIRC